MFQYFQGKIEKKGWMTFLIHDFIGVQISYGWKKSEWEFYLFPFYDENKRTVQYFAFDTVEQKQLFEQFLKVNWIWTKTAFQLAQTSHDELSNAVKNMDVKFFLWVYKLTCWLKQQPSSLILQNKWSHRKKEGKIMYQINKFCLIMYGSTQT